MGDKDGVYRRVSLMGIANAQYVSNQQNVTLQTGMLLDRRLEEFEEHQFLTRVAAIGASYGTLVGLSFRLSIHEDPS